MNSNPFCVNKEQSKKKNGVQIEEIQTALRLRPSNTTEKICQVQGSRVLVKKIPEPFDFNQVFDEKVNNQMIFDSYIQKIADRTILGFNSAICAYGQTSSGKTHTMRGSITEDGIVQLTVQYYFQQFLLKPDYCWTMKVQYIEVYNEQINDLFSGLPETKIPAPEKTNNNEPPPQPYRQFIAATFNDFLEAYKQGEAARHIGETKMNRNSSRSHVILILTLENRSKYAPFHTKSPQMMLVDLAGSESLQKSQTEGTTRLEGCHINKSLLSLQSVVIRLKENRKNNFVNFRDSKLTQILKPCLGGNSITLFLLTISQNLVNFQESVNTMKFGIAVGAIKNCIKITEYSDEIKQEILDSVNDELEYFKTSAKENEIKLQEKECAYKILTELNEDQKSQIENLIRELEKKDKLIQDSKQRIMDLEQKICKSANQFTDLEKRLYQTNTLLKHFKNDSKREHNNIDESTQTDLYQIEGQVESPTSKIQEQLQSRYEQALQEIQELKTLISQQKTAPMQPLDQQQKDQLQKSLKKQKEDLNIIEICSFMQNNAIEQQRTNLSLRNQLDEKDYQFSKLMAERQELIRANQDLKDKLLEYQMNDKDTEKDFWKQTSMFEQQENKKPASSFNQFQRSKPKVITTAMSPSKDYLKKQLQRRIERTQKYESQIKRQQQEMDRLQKQQKLAQDQSKALYDAWIQNFQHYK